VASEAIVDSKSVLVPMVPIEVKTIIEEAGAWQLAAEMCKYHDLKKTRLLEYEKKTKIADLSQHNRRLASFTYGILTTIASWAIFVLEEDSTGAQDLAMVGIEQAFTIQPSQGTYQILSLSSVVTYLASILGIRLDTAVSASVDNHCLQKAQRLIEMTTGKKMARMEQELAAKDQELVAKDQELVAKDQELVAKAARIALLEAQLTKTKAVNLEDASS